ncbi:MAG: ribosomal protein S18-alanine N-acetyltransferase [Anaerolineae bacterium]|nr:ribosomal protein S18-alanine N-acetyltransferase [Anaerolineae bacterium]
MMYVMRPMRLEDIPQVVQIDRDSFPTPWSAKTYQFELANRNTSQLVVVEARENTDTSPDGLRAMWQRLRGIQVNGQLAGYGGCWLIAGEAHISTIAVHPNFRGKGLGELLLAGMLQRSIHRGGEYSVLEVRESNTLAQNLYHKYEYQVNGRRKGYYRDNGEDALLMEARPLDSGYHERLKQRLAALRERVPYIDKFSE